MSPREKYSSRTSLAVLTRSRLAPVILNKIRQHILFQFDPRLLSNDDTICVIDLPDTLVTNIDSVLVLVQRHALPVLSYQGVTTGVSLA